MNVRVMLFGALREEAGASEVEWTLPAEARVVDLLQAVADRWPSVANWGDRLRVSVDLEIVSSQAALHEGAEVVQPFCK